MNTAMIERPVAVAPKAAGGSTLLGVYRPAGPEFVEGRGSWLISAEGRRYLDFTSGIGVNALGHGDAGVRAAIERALATGLTHTSNLFRTAPAQQLADALCAASFADRVFFCNSGGEANEGALKFARRYAGSTGAAAKHEVVALRGAFHGRLFGSLAATDRVSFRAPFEPLMPGVRFAAPDAAAVEAQVSRERTAAIIAEPVQGEGGVVPLPAGLLQELRAIADEADAVLIFDEVQCGLGRTGTLFAHETAGIAPDVMTLAKPLAGGLPMGAILLNERVAAAIQPGDHGTTFGGGPLVSSAALEVFNRVSTPAFLQTIRMRGEQIEAALGDLAGRLGVVAARGRGLMWGLELDRPAAPVVARALELGLLLCTAGERVIRLLPPLNVSEDEVTLAMKQIEQALS